MDAEQLVFDQIGAADPALNAFTGTRLNAVVDEFTQTDSAQIASGAEMSWTSQPPIAGPTTLAAAVLPSKRLLPSTS